MKLISNIKIEVNRLKKVDNIKYRVIHGGMWLGVGSCIEQGLRFLRNIILARLLTPQAFGIMAIILAVDTFFESFTEIGIKEAIVQNPKGNDHTYLNGAWWLAFIRSIILYLIVFASAPWIAKFYENPEIADLIRFAFLSVLFKGAMSANAYSAFKQMEFKKWIIIFHGGGVLGVITAIVLAFFIRDFWALAIGFTTETFARCFISYIICPFKPGLKFDRESVRSLLAYSRGMIGLPILTFIFMKSDIFVIGKVCTIYQLGLYTMAASLARMPSQFLGSLIGQVIMPMFSEIQNEKERMNQAIIKITSVIVLIGFPIFFFALFYGKEILIIIYGVQYAVVALPFAIIFGVEFLRVSATPLATFYFQTGRPSLQRLFTGIRAIIMLILIIPAIKWFGLTGAALAGLISMIVAFVFQVYRVNLINELNLKKYYFIFLKACLISLTIIVIYLPTNGYMSNYPILKVITGTLGCGFIYLITIRIFLNKREQPNLLKKCYGKIIYNYKKDSLIFIKELV